MTSVLELTRNRSRLKRELLRRIGYTNGLHYIFRFARVADYLWAIAPAAVDALVGELVEHENRRPDTSPKLKMNKYARGIVDVARALGLVLRIGRKVSPSDRGYAMHAVRQTASCEVATRNLLLLLVMESDGEYSLNLLDILGSGTTTVADAGHELLQRMLAIIGLKRSWAEREILGQVARKFVLAELDDAERTLQEAIDPSKKGAPRRAYPETSESCARGDPAIRFLEHTVVPRRQWLIDLGLLTTSGGTLALTRSGTTLMQFLEREGLRHSDSSSPSVLWLPVSAFLSQVLETPEPVGGVDLCWRAVTEAYCHSAGSWRPDAGEFLETVRLLYPHLRVRGFNEAEVDGLYHAVAALACADGKMVERSSFDSVLDEAVANYSSEVFRLSARRGEGGYIALKGAI